jgi:hypothetical protein
MLWQLPCFRPLPDVIKVTTSMLGVEVHKCFRCRWIPPDLTEHTNIHGTHQLLAKDIEAMGYHIVSFSQFPSVD